MGLSLLLLHLHFPLVFSPVRVFQFPQTQAKTGDPEQQIPLFLAVEVEGPFLENQGKALPGFHSHITLFLHGIGDFAEDDSPDVLEPV